MNRQKMPNREIPVPRHERGVALLAVLWLAVALSFMGMATAHMVRTEVTALSNQMDAQRSYYLARGGIEAAVYSIAHPLEVQPEVAGLPIPPSAFTIGKRWLQFEFPGGSCMVEVVPENAKLDVNQAPAQQLAALFGSLGLSANDSLDLAGAIAHWRSPRGSDADTPLDAFYAGTPEPYLARHAALKQVDELLPVRGMSRSLFFGHMERTRGGQWQKWPPLSDLLTAQSTGNAINPNYAAYEVLRVLPGWNDDLASAVLAARRSTPFRSLLDFQRAVPEISAVLAPITLQEGPAYTLTATGFLSGSGVHRSVRALVVIGPSQPLYHRVLGWWDNWSPQNGIGRNPAN
jgi:type II secretory pathway component PulK